MAAPVNDAKACNNSLRLDVSCRCILALLMFTSTTISLSVLFGRLVCFRAVCFCLVLSVTYVGSMYVWRQPDLLLTRNHEAVIKRRFISVTFASLFAACVFLLHRHLTGDHEYSLCEELGFRLIGSIQAIILPLLLTIVLFTGPLLLYLLDGVYIILIDFRYLKSNMQDIMWLRNNVVAPLSEEFNFRSCMLPILIPCLGIKWSILCSPLFFGVAHAHHMLEKIVHGMNFKDAVLTTLFHFSITTVFGIYSAFLFVRTGNFLAPFVAHSFCNLMGFPDFGELLMYKQPLRTGLVLIYVLGLVGWYYLLFPLTNPDLYYNSMWQKYD